VEGPYTILETYRTRWVLDMEGLEGNYFERRFQMLKLDMPYKLYPLNKGHRTLGSLLEGRAKCKTYIDSEGKLLEWKPQKYYPTKSYRITEKWIPRDIPRLCFAIEPSCEIFWVDAPNYPANFARVVEMGNRRILYDVTEHRMKDTRIKL
jgi:hypothetical protein